MQIQYTDYEQQKRIIAAPNQIIRGMKSALEEQLAHLKTNDICRAVISLRGADELDLYIVHHSSKLNEDPIEGLTPISIGHDITFSEFHILYKGSRDAECSPLHMIMNEHNIRGTTETAYAEPFLEIRENNLRKSLQDNIVNVLMNLGLSDPIVDQWLRFSKRQIEEEAFEVDQIRCQQVAIGAGKFMLDDVDMGIEAFDGQVH